MKKHILLVEDTVEHCRLFVQACARSYPDAEVRVATSGEVALETMFVEYRADLLVLDLDLPGISGLTVLESIRSQTRWKELPIVVFSQDKTDAARYASMRMGASYYQVKPTSRTGFDAFVAFLATSLEHDCFRKPLYHASES